MHNKYFICWLSGVFFLMVTFFSVYPAVVVLKSGENIQGTITKQTEQEIEINVSGESKKYPMREIETIKGNKPIVAESKSEESKNRESKSEEVKSPESQARDEFDPDALFKKALLLAANGKFSEAEELCKKILEKIPDEPQATQALKTCEEVRDGKFKPLYAQSLFRGVYSMLEDNTSAAIEAFKKAVEIDPNRDEAYYNLGYVYQSLNHYEEAITYFKKVIERNPDDEHALFEIGISLYSASNYREAIPYFEKLISQDPDNPELQALLGMSHRWLGNREASNQYLGRARELFKEEGDDERAQEMDNLLSGLL
ncbi:MAG: tetratricopeptide repeat protein [Candidatus Omnitrophota bacterium]